MSEQILSNTSAQLGYIQRHFTLVHAGKYREVTTQKLSTQRKS